MLVAQHCLLLVEGLGGLSLVRVGPLLLVVGRGEGRLLIDF